MINEQTKELYNKVLAIAKNSYSSNRAEKIALSIIRDKFVKVGDTYVARSEDFKDYKTLHYEFVSDEANISRSEDGFTTIDYVLSSDSKDSYGTTMSPLFLNSMVDQINNEGLVGRVSSSHDLYNSLLKKGLSQEEIEEEMQKMKTGVKAISAKLVDNKVVAKVRVAPNIDVTKYNGASIEARIPSNAIREGVVTQGRLQGFILTDRPSNPDSYRVE